ncbi:hypothetical protein [Streptomyces chrestomyceticus]|uniref:hypothetical protein n=1 Tax=Streptomyces chrestomyceticus TaxID=68185 RepID=UPI0035A83A65
MSDGSPLNAILLSMGIASYILAAYKIRAWRRHRIPGVLVLGTALATSGTSFLIATLFTSRT